MERDGKLTTGGYIIVRKSMARNENSANNAFYIYASTSLISSPEMHF